MTVFIVIAERGGCVQETHACYTRTTAESIRREIIDDPETDYDEDEGSVDIHEEELK